jgi:hypothetical protein
MATNSDRFVREGEIKRINGDKRRKGRFRYQIMWKTK